MRDGSWNTTGKRFTALDRRLFARATESSSPRLDAAVYPLSRAADHSKLWIGCAAVLFATGKEPARRAAFRGLVAVGITSAVSNAILKPIFRRARPSDSPSIIFERFARVPNSTSFPSGHAASAFAFAVACGLEVPALSVPLGAAAAVVAYSRVRTRVHYPGDVIAGIALGSGIALAARKLWPGAGSASEATRRRSSNIDGSAITDGEGLSIVVNPSAGPGGSGEVTTALREYLPRARVIEVGDAPMDAAVAEAADASVLGIVGGDGSINAAAQQALSTGRPLAVFPGGTLNHFARDLGIGEVSDTIDALHHGDLVAVDVGTIAGQPFLNTASFGSYAEFVDVREKLEGRLGKWPAALVAAARVLRRSEPVRVELNGERLTLWMIFIGNCEYQPAGLAPTSRERLDDQRFDVRYIDGSSRWSRIRVVGALAIGQLARAKVFTRVLVESLDVHSLDGPLRLARDGETFDGGVDVRVSKHPDRLAVYAPHQE